MLTLTVAGREYWDDKNQTFSYPESYVLQLEHSLVSLSKWEAIFQRPFLSQKGMSDDEIYTYIRCMAQDEVSVDQLQQLGAKELEAIHDYMNSKESATWFSENGPQAKGSGEQITSELIYFWLVSFQIPLEVEHWHLNRLFSLLRIASVKNSKPKKMNRQEALAQQRELNRKRREQTGSRG